MSSASLGLRTNRTPNHIESSIIGSSNQTEFGPMVTVRVYRLLMKALECQAIKDLYDRANSIDLDQPSNPRPWKIVFQKSLKAQGICSFPNREIWLCESLCEDLALSQFVFELTNACQQKNAREIFDKLYSGEFDGEGYTMSIERLEYAGGLLHSKIMKQAIKELSWPNYLDHMNCLNNISFNDVWHEYKRFSRHANTYRDRYALATGTKPYRLGLIAKVQSAVYLATHITKRDLKSIVCALAMSIILSPITRIPLSTLTITTLMGVALQKVLKPFLFSIFELEEVLPLSTVAVIHHFAIPAISMAGLLFKDLKIGFFGTLIGSLPASYFDKDFIGF